MDTKYKRPIWFDYKILRMRTTKLMNVIINSNCILPPNLLKRRETVKQSAIQFNVSITPSCRTNWCVYIWLLLRGCGGEGKIFFSALYVVNKKTQGKAQNFCWLWVYLGLNLSPVLLGSPADLPYLCSWCSQQRQQNSCSLEFQGWSCSLCSGWLVPLQLLLGEECTIQIQAREAKANPYLHCYSSTYGKEGGNIISSLSHYTEHQVLYCA